VQSFRKKKSAAGEEIPAFYGTTRLIHMLIAKQLNAATPLHAVFLTYDSPI